MPLFGRRRQPPAAVEPPARGLAGDATAMRSTLAALQVDAERGRGGAELDLRALVRELLDGEVAAPTADVRDLIARRTDPDDFYRAEIAPSWDGLGEAQRAARLDGFIDLVAMLEEAGANSGLPPEMGAVVRTKTLILAWAFDELYGYLSRLARGEGLPNGV